jgi:hypothetical protein
MRKVKHLLGIIGNIVKWSKFENRIYFLTMDVQEIKLTLDHYINKGEARFWRKAKCQFFTWLHISLDIQVKMLSM